MEGRSRQVVVQARYTEIGGALADPATEVVAAEAAPSRLWGRLFALAVAAMVALIVLRPLYIPVVNGDHYVYLAEHLVRGELSVNDIPGSYSDVITWQGNKYLPFGPLPAVLLIPFLPILHLLNTREESWVGMLLTLLNVFLLARILKQIGIEGDRRKWALLLFFGGTIYYAMTVVAATWYFAHIVVTTCLLLAISEALGKRRMWLVGVFLGLAGMTRVTAIFALPFFLWLVWRTRASANGGEADTSTIRQKVWASTTLLAGLAGPVLILMAYNYVRFDSPLESGYGMAVLTYSALDEARKQGIFSVVHIPKNLFMMLLQGPVAYPSADAPVLQFPYIQPSPWGMGLFFTTPALVYIFRSKLKEPFAQACWIGVVCVMLPIITYYGVGWVQFGYRYALDFLPFLFLLAALGLPKSLTNSARVLILASVAINIWGAIFFSKWV